MKNLLKFISIGLVLMVVVFSQITQNSSKVEAATVSENDIEFMDTSAEVVKFYKADSSGQNVAIYVRDSDLNTTFTGETTWVSASGSLDRVVNAGSTWTLDLNNSAKTIVSATILEQKVTTVGLHANHTRTDYTDADMSNVATTSAVGTGLTLNCVTKNADDTVESCAVGNAAGTGYSVDDLVVVPAANHAGAQDLTVKVTAVATVAGTVGHFTKAEDSDSGVTSGPNLFIKGITPVKLNSLTVKKGNTSLFTDALDETNGTFSLNANVQVGDTIATDGVKASYSFKAQDTYTRYSTGDKRVHITSSSDSTGEWIMIKEVTAEGDANSLFTGGIVSFDGISAADAARTPGTYTVLPGEYTYAGSGLGAVFEVTIDSDGAGTVAVKDGHAGTGYADGNTITFPAAKIGTTGADLTANVQDLASGPKANVDTGLFLGNVTINTDASAGAPDNGSVWVQDGDTLTASFYKAKNTTDDTTGDLIKSTTATIDATAPTISDLSPADGTLTKDTTPSISFTIADEGSGFKESVSDFKDHVDVFVNGCAIPDDDLGVTAHSTSSISISYNAAVKWTDDAKKADGAVVHASKDCTNGAAAARASGGFNVTADGTAVELTSSTVHGTLFSWRVEASDVATNSKSVGDKVHDNTGVTGDEGDLDLRIDTKAPSSLGGSLGVTGALAWSTSDKKDVTDNSSIKLSFDESLDVASVTASDFTVSGVGVTSSTIETVTFGGKDAETDRYVYLDLAADLGPNAKPKVKLVGQITDKAGNILKPLSSETTGKTLGTASDSVKPTLATGAVTNALIAKDGKSDITYTSNENLTKTTGTFNAARGTYGSIGGGGKGSGSSGVVTLDGTDNGKVSITLSTPTSGKGTVKHKTAHSPITMTLTGIYGVTSVGRDAADNVGTGGITKVVEDVSDQITADWKTEGSVGAGDTLELKLKNWPLADHDGDGSLQDSITSITVGGSAPATLQYVDAAPGTGTTQGGFRSGLGAITTTTPATLGAADPQDDDLDATYTIVTTQAHSSADGAGATVVITSADDARTLVSVVGGSGYAVDETITIPDELMGDAGANGSVPAVITVKSVSDTGTPTSASPVTTYVEKVDWSKEEKITLKTLDESDLNITSAHTVKVTYYYVNPEQVIELDLDAPAVVIKPANLDVTTDRTPSISIAWDDDEYAGDTHTTVEMTKAELKDPDGVTSDIKDLLSTTDNKTYYYRPAADLVNGEYTITVSGKDDAGNEQKDKSSKFTVKDRENTKIAMEPGWNLMSLPADAADPAINSVLDNSQIDTVLTYDPSTPGGWLTSVRDGDSLVGTIENINSTHGYWIFQKNGDDVKVDLPGYKGGASTTPPVISVVEGWNLVSAVTLTIGQTTPATAVDPDKYFLGLDWVKAKGWNAGDKEWIEVLADRTASPNISSNTLNGAVDITFGKGYWLYANKAGVIVP